MRGTDIECFLDASVAIAWLLDDEENSLAGAAAHSFPKYGSCKSATLCSPPIAVGASPRDGANERLRSLKELPICIDVNPALETAFELARGHHSAICDAVYLELASRRNEALSILDPVLVRAATVEGLPLVAAS